MYNNFIDDVFRDGVSDEVFYDHFLEGVTNDTIYTRDINTGEIVDERPLYETYLEDGVLYTVLTTTGEIVQRESYDGRDIEWDNDIDDWIR